MCWEIMLNEFIKVESKCEILIVNDTSIWQKIQKKEENLKNEDIQDKQDILGMKCMKT